jgi:hypothetical protein
MQGEPTYSLTHSYPQHWMEVWCVINLMVRQFQPEELNTAPIYLARWAPDTARRLGEDSNPGSATTTHSMCYPVSHIVISSIKTWTIYQICCLQDFCSEKSRVPLDNEMRTLSHDLNISVYIFFKFQLTDQIGSYCCWKLSGPYLPRLNTGMGNYFVSNCAATTRQPSSYKLLPLSKRTIQMYQWSTRTIKSKCNY